MSVKITADNKLKKLIVVGDRVLIRPPKNLIKLIVVYICHLVYRRKKKFKKGMSLKLALAIRCLCQPMKMILWKGKEDQIKYLPLQAQEGDLAIFLQRGAIEVMYEGQKYFIVPQVSILMLEREEEL
jgi:chaperonin GroES